MRFRSVLLLMAVVVVMPAKAQEKHAMTVTELFNLVESNSKTLQETKTSVEFAQQGIEAARAQRLPDVNASLSASYNGNVVVMDRDFTNAQGFSSPHFGNSFALEAQQVVYAGGAIDAGIKMAELQRDMAVSGQRMTLNAQRFLALGQYLDLFKIQNRMQVYEQNIALTRRLIDDIRAKQQQGMALKNDVTRYELQMETLRLGLRQLQDQQAILNHQLCNTLGLKDVAIQPDTTIVESGQWTVEQTLTSHLSPLKLAADRPRLVATDGAVGTIHADGRTATADRQERDAAEGSRRGCR